MGMKILSLWFITALAMLPVAYVQASCACVCISGTMVCTASPDKRDECAPRSCSKPAATAPKPADDKPHSLPSARKTRCALRQYYNTQTRRYDWRNVCH